MPFHESCETLSVTIRYRTITVNFVEHDRSYEVRFRSLGYTGLHDLLLILSKISELPPWRFFPEFHNASPMEVDTAAQISGSDFFGYVDCVRPRGRRPSKADDYLTSWLYWYDDEEWICLLVPKADVDRVIGGALRWLEHMDEVDDRIRARRQHQD